MSSQLPFVEMAIAVHSENSATYLVEFLLLAFSNKLLSDAMIPESYGCEMSKCTLTEKYFQPS